MLNLQNYVKHVNYMKYVNYVKHVNYVKYVYYVDHVNYVKQQANKSEQIKANKSSTRIRLGAEATPEQESP